MKINKFTEEVINELISENDDKIEKVVVVYGGRFQPFHSGHFDSYSKLKSKFKNADVYIATTDKVELPKSPFNFKEKKSIIQKMFGINPNFIQQVKNVYSPVEILKKYDPKTTSLVIFVSSKDANRFKIGKYFRPWDGSAEVGFLDGGYVYIDDPGGGGLSGTEVRSILKTGTDEEKLAVFKKLYPKFDKKIYDLIVSKLNENLFVSKTVISNWLKNKTNQKLLEISIATWPAFGKPVDDGPGLFLRDLEAYKGVNAERAAKLGWHIINHLANDTVEDYNELRDIGYVTNFEIGVPERRTDADRYDMMSGKSYNDWLNSVTDTLALVGYSVLQDKYAQKELELQKKLSKRDVLTNPETITTQELQEIKNNLIEAMVGISIDSGEPNPSYTPDGLLRLLDRGKPEPWFKQLGYTQVDKPRASYMRGRLKKDQSPDLQTRKVSYKVQNVKTSTLKPALKPVGSTEWVPANPEEDMDKFKNRKSKSKPKLKEDLRKWLGSGPTGGWDRYSTTGEKLGKCGDAKEGEPYSVCLSNEKARKLGKKGIASFVRRKRDAQKKAGDAKKGGEQKKGQKPVFVKTGVNERLEEVMSLFLEKNEPTNPKKWSYAIAQAKKRFDVYPSAYANAWAAKKYKELGGKWKKTESQSLTEIPMGDLKKIDQFADKQLAPLDVVITDTHFFDRLNDPRNDKPISSAELIGFFKRLHKNKKKFIEFLKQYGQIVAKDNRTNINIPFMNVANKVIAKTVMRKSDFKTSNPKFAFEGLFTSDNALKPYEKLLIGSIIEFMRGKYGINSKIIVKKKESRGTYGDIVLNDNTLNKDKFYLHFNPNASYSFIIHSIIHELIHVKQISKGELRPSPDYKELLWKGKSVISVSDYKKFQRKNFNEYKKLPWEAEAYGGMKPLYREFLKSKQFQSLKGKDENLDNIISNLTENLMMGYPDQKWIDDHNKELKRLRKKFDSEFDGDDQYEPIKESYYVDEINGLVKCAVCNNWMKQIQYKHLKYSHNMTMDEYKTKYPNLPLISESLKNVGIKNPMKNDTVKKNHLLSVNTDEYKKKISESLTGKNIGNKRPDVSEKNKKKDFIKKVSDGVKKSYQNNPNLKEKRSAIGKKYGFGNKDVIKKISDIRNYTKPENKEPFQLYTEQVRNKTNENFKKYFYEITYAKNRNRNFHLDHKYSIKDGFDNNIPIEIISHYKNLQILDGRLNESKGTKSSLTLNELITDIQNSKNPIDGRTLLLCGGAYGHLAHPFETDINLTFKDLKDIINKALDGKLELTREKTDGMNITVSWKNGKLVAARAKSQLKNKGESAMDATQLAEKFKDRGAIADAFNFAMRDLSKAISSLSEKDKEAVFGEGSKFMSLEVIYPEASNVIVYGQPLLVFHGTLEYDMDGNPIGEDPNSGKILEKMLKSVNQTVQDKFSIRSQPSIKLPTNQNLTNLKPKYLGMVSKLQNEFKLKDTNNVVDYHKAWWKDYITKNAPTAIDPTVMSGLVNRWAIEDKSFRLDKKNITDEKLLSWAIGLDKKDFSKFKKENFMKFEDIFLGVGSDILSFISSALVVNPSSTVKTIKDKLDATISDIRKSGDPDKINKLELELRRLNAIGGMDEIIPVEGIVFVYNNIPMKLTGKFAAINQILSIMYRG